MNARWYLLAALVLTAGCRREMYNQPRSNPLGRSEFFTDGAASRPLIPGTIARGQLHEDEAFYTGKIGTNLVRYFPMPITLALLQRGQERYNIYCAVCHGPAGEGNGVIVQRGFPAPPSYHIDRLREAPPGYLFDVMTRGYGVMYSYASRVEAPDRWAIAAYIHALQRSQHEAFSHIPAMEQARLNGEKL